MVITILESLQQTKHVIHSIGQPSSTESAKITHPWISQRRCNKISVHAADDCGPGPKGSVHGIQVSDNLWLPLADLMKLRTHLFGKVWKLLPRARFPWLAQRYRPMSLSRSSPPSSTDACGVGGGFLADSDRFEGDPLRPWLCRPVLP